MAMGNVSVIIYVPFGACWWFMEPILWALGQDLELSRNVQEFLRILSFGIPPYIWFEYVMKYHLLDASRTLSTLLNSWLLKEFLTYCFISDVGQINQKVFTSSRWVLMIKGF